MPNSIWETYKVQADAPDLHLVLGEMNTWVKRRDDEFWIAHQYKKEMESDIEKEDEIEWSRWVHKSTSEDIKIAPVFPDLPIIVSSEFPLKLAPGSKIQIFTRVPVWMQISLDKSDYILTEIPSVKLSRTWFGTTREGELCYYLTTKARRNLANVEIKPYVINCPIWITNEDSKDLNFDKFCFRVERLGVYQANEELWADETKIVYHGEELNSDITMTGKLPANLGKSEKLSKPRNPLSKSFTTRTFKRLFDDTFTPAR